MAKETDNSESGGSDSNDTDENSNTSKADTSEEVDVKFSPDDIPDAEKYSEALADKGDIIKDTNKKEDESDE